MFMPDTAPPPQLVAAPPPAVCTLRTPRDSVTADCTVIALTEGRATGIGFMFSASLSIQFLGVMHDDGLHVSHVSLNDEPVTRVLGFCASVGRSIACMASGVEVTAVAK